VENLVEKGLAVWLAFRYTFLEKHALLHLPGTIFYLFHFVVFFLDKEDQAMTIETERSTAGRSALRYRPIHTDQASRSGTVLAKRGSHPGARVIAAPPVPDDLKQEKDRLPYRQGAAPHRKVMPASLARTRRRFHPLFFIGLGLFFFLLLWIGTAQALTWGNNELNTLRYGMPPTFQIDVVVGQSDSRDHPSHFIATNLHGTIVIIDFPASDPSRARDFEITSLVGPSADQAVVTLRFVDVNHNGKPDMLIDINGFQSVLMNEHGTFQPPTATEQQQILEALQQ
jgi:hypothetical protein